MDELFYMKKKLMQTNTYPLDSMPAVKEIVSVLINNLSLSDTLHFKYTNLLKLLFMWAIINSFGFMISCTLSYKSFVTRHNLLMCLTC